jgi:hypothetical protein
LDFGILIAHLKFLIFDSTNIMAINLKKFPEVFLTLKLNSKLDAYTMVKVREGKPCRHQDDRWVIFFEEPWLYFYRTSKFSSIFKAHIEQKGVDYYLDEVLVDVTNTNLDQTNALETFEDVFNLFLNAQL